MASTLLSQSSHRAPSFFMLVVVLIPLILGVLSSPLDLDHPMPGNIIGARFPADAQTPAQQAAFAEAEKLVKEVFGSSFQLKDPQGNLLGPFGILSYTPTTFLAYLNYTQAYTTLPTLTPKERELSILATASVTNSAYILYAHKSIAVTVGLTPLQAESASKGKVPDNLQDREAFVYSLALKIAQKFGTFSDELFGQAVAELGREGVAQLSQLVGGYLLSSVLVNVADVAVPLL